MLEHEPSLENLVTPVAAKLPKGRLIRNGIQFSSRSEAACAAMMTKYIKGWECAPGKTFQVNISHGHRCDFRIASLFVEYHPIRLQWEFRSRPAYRQLENNLHRCRKEVAKQLRRALKEEFKSIYYSQRRWVMDHSKVPDIQEGKLLCVHSPEEFVVKVIKPLGRVKASRAQLVREFNRLLRKP